MKPKRQRRIEAEMRPDWIEPYAKAGELIPVVAISAHPRFPAGTRLDWGFIHLALLDGYDIKIRAAR